MTMERQLLAFRDELTKTAVGPGALQFLGKAIKQSPAAIGKGLSTVRRHLGSEAVHGGVGGLAAGAGAGSMAGGVLGAGEGGVQGFRQAREAGLGLGGSVLHGLSVAGQKGLQRAAQGALAGGALGAAAGGKAQALTNMPGLGAGARFGQRQLHGLTGWAPKAGIRSIRGGSYVAEKGLDDAAATLRKAVAKDKGVGKAQKGLSQAQKYLEAATKAEQMGLTSLPGYAKALRKSPVEALKAGFGEQWHASPGLMRALVYGGTGVSAGSELAKGADPSGEGRGRLERAGRTIGSALPLMAGPLPLTATLAATPVGLAAGGLAGKMGDRLARLRARRGESPAPPSLEPAGGDAGPVERVYSDRASGMVPEGVG